jgi:hypothetical protein
LGGHTPSSPSPFPSSNSRTTRSSSFCKLRRLCCWASVLVGNARIHFCSTAQRLGPGRRGWMTFKSSLFTGWPSAATSTESMSEVPFDVGIVLAALMGRTACHCPSLRATPRQTFSVTRSSWVAGRPRMNRYKRPFLNRARSGGAKPYLARSACEFVSPGGPFYFSICRIGQWKKGLAGFAYFRGL